MKRWDCRISDRVESKNVDTFLDEIEVVCKKYGFSISHEDGHGAFEIEDFNESDMEWLKYAHITENCTNAQST